jgi:hypothetical protein
MKIPKELMDRLAVVERGKVDTSPLILFSHGKNLAAGDESMAARAEAQDRLVVVIERFGEAA